MRFYVGEVFHGGEIGVSPEIDYKFVGNLKELFFIHESRFSNYNVKRLYRSINKK